jgi:transmembrane carrier protein
MLNNVYTQCFYSHTPGRWKGVAGRGAVEVLSGGAAGVLATCAVYPLDVVKVLLLLCKLKVLPLVS